jgi:hypothetical protein
MCLRKTGSRLDSVDRVFPQYNSRFVSLVLASQLLHVLGFGILGSALFFLWRSLHFFCGDPFILQEARNLLRGIFLKLAFEARNWKVNKTLVSATADGAP